MYRRAIEIFGVDETGERPQTPTEDGEDLILVRPTSWPLMSVCHTVLNGREVLLPYSYQSTFYLYICCCGVFFHLEA